MQNNLQKKLYSMIIGAAIGDILGYPVQFIKREKSNKITDKRLIFIANKFQGIYSDDTAMTLCLLDSLNKHNWQELDYKDIMDTYIKWINTGYLTCTEKAIDVGISTRKALTRYYNGVPIELCGCQGYWECGNGSLMRIAPLAFYLYLNPSTDKLKVVKNISSLTHAHNICTIGCYIYISILLSILKIKNVDKLTAVKQGIEDAKKTLNTYSPQELNLYNRVFNIENLLNSNIEDIKSSGYIIDTLEAALYCYLKSDNYQNAIISAIKLGDDTDTIASITGSLSGLYYGYDNIPKSLINIINENGLKILNNQTK